MTRLLLGVVAGLLACTGILRATDVTGKWSGIAGAPIYVTFKQDGAKLSGSAGQAGDEQTLELADGKVEGDRLTFRAGTLQFDLRVRGDELAGDLNAGGETFKVVLKRVDPAAASSGPKSFDVASVKRAPAAPNGAYSSIHLDPGRLTCTNVNLRKLIGLAYSIKDYQLSGPEWMGSELYNITATFPAGASGEEILPMIRTLLAERFQFAFHRDTKELPVYALVLAKGGSKLKPAEFGRTSNNGGVGYFDGQRSGIQNLANFLARQLDRPVLDMTGLKGVFDFNLDWSPDDTPSETKPDLTTALQQQLGLKLEARKAPIEVMVVDRLEKVPTEN